MLNLKEQTEKTTKHVQAIFKYAAHKGGYTLIEAVITLGVLVMLSSVVPLLLIPIQKHPPISQLEETSLFFSMLGKEIREGTSVQVQNNTLFIIDANGDIKSFSKYHSIIRKQINGLGHEVWVQNISGMIVKKLSDFLISVKVIDNEGKEFQHVFRRIM